MPVPYVYGDFISVPGFLIVLYDPDFYNISLDLFQFRPSIEINYIFCLHFGPYFFNFGFCFNSLNLLGITIWIIFNFILQLKYTVFLFRSLFF